nr:hypothetical protein Iba_chr03cCG12560 [Ipomoea batatas]
MRQEMETRFEQDFHNLKKRSLTFRGRNNASLRKILGRKIHKKSKAFCPQRPPRDSSKYYGPFLATREPPIDVGNGKLVLRVGDECATFDVLKLTKYPMTTDDACYFVDVLHEHVDSFYPNLVGKVKDDALLTVLDSNDDLETFTFDNDASINEKDESIHDIVCGDDNDIPIDENVCEMNDIEFVNFFDDCVDDAVYIHDLIGEEKEETDGDLRDVLFKEVHGKIIEEEEEKTRDESVKEKVEEKVRNDEKDRVEIARVEELRAKGAWGGYFFDLSMLEAYGCGEEVERMLTRPSWAHLFSWSWGKSLDSTPPRTLELRSGETFPLFFDSDAAAEAYWFEITNGQGGRFTGTKPNTSKVVRSPLLMMKLLLKSHQLFTSQTQPKCPYVWIGPVITRLCHGLGLQAELAREKSIASMQPFTEAHLGRSYAPRIGAAPRPRREEQPQEQEPVVQGGPDVPPEYAEYPPVYDWASMRAFQLQLHNQSMNAFNQRMDLHHEELIRQNEAIARQKRNIHEARRTPRAKSPKQLNNCAFGGAAFPTSPTRAGTVVDAWSLGVLVLKFSWPGLNFRYPAHPWRSEPSRRPNDDTSSEEGEAPMMEVAHRGLMIEVEDLFRYRHFRDKQIIEWNYIEAPVLAVLGIQREFERMTSQPFWSHICGWRDATYVPIVREFIATLEVDERVHNRRQPSIRFKLFNRRYNLSSDELGNLLGFYTLHDQDQGWYANLVDDFPNEHQPGLFWWGIARQGVAWRPSYTSAKYIKVPELKIMWHIVARSWLGRQSPNDNVTSRELFILWSIYTGTPIHMGELCKAFLKRQSYEDSESIFVGPIVSRLCEALGFEDALAFEAVATTMTPLDIGDFLQFGIAPEEPSEDEERGEQRDLLGIIERLENRVNMLEHEVRRLKLERFGEESDGAGI